MYYNDIFQFGKDEKFLVMFFSKILTGNALQWYTNLDRSQASSWRELSKAFLAHLCFNLELQPRNIDLERMNPKTGESMNE